MCWADESWKGKRKKNTEKREKEQLSSSPYQQLRKKQRRLICIQLSVHKFSASSFVVVRFWKFIRVHIAAKQCRGRGTERLHLQWLSSFFSLHRNLEVCARTEGQPASSSALLCGSHNAHSSWRLEGLEVQGGPSLSTSPCLITFLPWPRVHPALFSK